MRIEQCGIRLEIKVVDKELFEIHARHRGVNTGIHKATEEIDALTQDMLTTLIKGITALSNMYASFDKEEEEEE